MRPSVGQRIVGGKRNAFWIIAAVLTALDQLTKHWMCNPRAGTWTVVPGFCRLVPARPNVHGVFSMGPGRPLFYVVATVIGLGVIAWFLVTTPDERRRPFIALGCIAAGALGNLIDRIMLGAVRDFIDLHWLDKAHWPTFNVADSGICIGVAILLWEAFRPARPSPATHSPADG